MRKERERAASTAEILRNGALLALPALHRQMIDNLLVNENMTIAERIADALGERIINGSLRPDAPLRQDHIAREFSSSHVPVREAFRHLEAKHLVVTVPRRGVRVASLDSLAVREIAEMRAALEVVALRNSASNLTSHAFGVIELALTDADNAQTIEEFESANRAFHHALVAPCGMPRLLASLDGLQLANSRLVFAMARSGGWRPRSNQDHRLILQALRACNVDRACELLARHIQTIERLSLSASDAER